MVISNENVREIITEIPPGHKHLRTTIVLKDGAEMTFHEAKIANLLRAYVTVKSHPKLNRVRLLSQRLDVDERKDGYAEWQLLEMDEKNEAE